MPDKDLISDYDSTAANNTDVGGVNIAEGCNFGNMNNMGREIMSHLADHFAQSSLASGSASSMATTAAHYVNITGTTTISSFGTVKAGTEKVVRFDGALQLTHNGTSFILPGAANITTVAGDIAAFVSEGSGNWRCTAYQRGAAGPDGGDVSDSVFRIVDNGDTSKKIAFEVSGITTATTRTVTLPDSDVNIYPEASAANYRAATADKTLVCDTVWDAMAEVALTSSSNAVAWDMSSGIDFKIDTLGENTTIGAPSNTTVGKKGRLRIVQDGTGSRTVAWNAVFEFAGGAAPTATTTASAQDLFYYDVITSSRILISPILDIS